MTCGIHIIWTTYGTWMPGDERGHWSPLFDFYGDVLVRGGKLNPPDSMTRQRAQERMPEAPKWLSSEEMTVIADELANHITPPNPPAWAAAIEANHVHLLVGPVKEDISRFAGRLKGRTSSVVGAMPANADRNRVWTSGYWKVYLFNEIAVGAVQHYIENHNLRRGLAAAPYPWITSRPI